MNSLRLKYSDDGKAEVVDGGEEQLADPRSVDWRAGEPERTMRTLRAQVATLEKQVRAPREAALDMLFAYGEVLSESRALGETTDSVGAVLLANTKAAGVIELVSRAAAPILNAVTLFPTATGSECVQAIDDDWATDYAAAVAENQISNTTANLVLAAISWPKTLNVRCGFIIVPFEMPNIRDVVYNLSARRYGRLLAKLAVAAVAAGADVAATVASATAITLPELKSLKASVDAAHQASASFVMNPLVYDAMVALTTTGAYEFDTQGNPTLLGKRCFLEPAMPLMTSSAKAISYGDHSALYRREVTDSMVLRSFPERFAERGQSSYELSARVDFALAVGSATPVPVKVLAMHA